MANTQVNIISNGTTTLATAGKCCDRNIDVNVDVPVSEITPTGSITITTNGTHNVTNYASAVVNVAGGQATQFTNLYNPANVVLKTLSNYSSSSGSSFTTDNYVNYIVIPYNHKANDPIALRVRGISCPVRDRQGFVMYGEDGTTAVAWGQLSTAVTITYDEHGDAVLTFGSSSTFVAKAWNYLHLNFQYCGVNGGASVAYEGPIITINEPIGNGGYVGGN